VKLQYVGLFDDSATSLVVLTQVQISEKVSLSQVYYFDRPICACMRGYATCAYVTWSRVQFFAPCVPEASRYTETQSSTGMREKAATSAV
jgi:hypothetical protein